MSSVRNVGIKSNLDVDSSSIVGASMKPKSILFLFFIIFISSSVVAMSNIICIVPHKRKKVFFVIRLIIG